jgi:hypothetical protein
VAPDPPDAPEPPGAPEAPDPPEPPEARERPDPDLTANRAVLVVARPEAFVNTARYSLPFCVCLAVNVSVTRWAPGTLVQVLPPLTERCHWVLGAGVPEAAAVKPARAPGATFTLWGCTMTAGRRLPPRG